MEYVMGIDLGTSSLKVIIVNKDGTIKFKTSSEYDIESPQAGYSEQNPAIWLEAFEKCLEQINKASEDILPNILGVSVSGQMHTLVTLDADYKVIRNAILWNDTRTTKQCELLNSNFKSILLDVTKNIALEGFTLPKLLWMKDNEKTNFSNIFKICMPKDYLIYCLTGVLQTELSDAAGTLLLDLESNNWSREICKMVDVPYEILPKINSSENNVGSPTTHFIKKYNFNPDAKIFSGGADNALSALGASLVDQSKSLLSIGTSGVVLKVNNEIPKADGKCHIFNHALNGLTYSMGVTLSAGYSLKWFKEVFFKNSNYDEIMQLTQKSQVGSNGILFNPWLFGERTPYIDSDIRGNFLGISSNCKKEDFSRAVIEGITFSLKSVISTINLDENNLTLVSVGGGSNNNVWLQLQADILNANIYCLQNNEGAATGAAIIAAVGIGWFNDYKTCCEKFVQIGKKYIPDKEHALKYQNIFKLYLEVYNMTKDFYKIHKKIFLNN